jgi:hypothetical protein
MRELPFSNASGPVRAEEGNSVLLRASASVAQTFSVPATTSRVSTVDLRKGFLTIICICI